MNIRENFFLTFAGLEPEQDLGGFLEANFSPIIALLFLPITTTGEFDTCFFVGL